MVKKIYFLMFIGLYTISGEYVSNLKKIDFIPKNIREIDPTFQRQAFTVLNNQSYGIKKQCLVYDQKNKTAACIQEFGEPMYYQIAFYHSNAVCSDVYQEHSKLKPSLIGINKNLILMMTKKHSLYLLEVPPSDNTYYGRGSKQNIVCEKNLSEYIDSKQTVSAIYSGNDDGEFYLETDDENFYLLTIKEKATIENTANQIKNDLQKVTTNGSGNPKKSLSHWFFTISGLGIVAFGILFFIIKFKSKSL